jgi:hypothetical protein
MSEHNDTGPDSQEPSEFEVAQLAISMRIYDVLMALLTKQDPDMARELLELHATGALAGPSPAYIGEFLTDKVNALP